jgi:hypothetical protein
MVTFEDEAQWSKGLLTFWAYRNKKRIQCTAGLETIAEFAGFTHATKREIGSRKTEVQDLLKPHLRLKIERNDFEESSIPTITIFVHDLGRVQ